jgi:fatty-acyl-CoA synthase
MTELVSSYVHGIGTEPLVGESIGSFFRRTAAARGDADALVASQQGIRWSWSEFAERVDRFAAGLLALGLVPGDRVAIWAQNRAEWTVAQFATARAGLILVNINPAARTAELQESLRLVGARALILQDHFKSSDYIAMARELMPELDEARPGGLASAAIPSLELVIRLGRETTPGMLRFDDVLERSTPTAREHLESVAAEVDFGDPANIQFSSATGEYPAGATLTHHNLLNNALTVARTLRLAAHDRVCIPVPLFHSFGMVIGNLACLASGATMVYPADAFDARATLAAIAGERCTACYGVPAMFIGMLEHEDFASFDLSSLRTGVMAGAPCPIETMRQVVRDMHMEQVTIAYGMTESSPVSFMSDIDDPLERRVATVGTIRAHVEAKVIDAEGRVVAPGTPGELCVRGYNVMRGYWNDPDYTARVIDAGGWLHTGDLAQLDAAGYCSIVGGVKDTIIRGGENISPAEVEDFLARHEAIGQVLVVGVPDQRMGEELCACVVPASGQVIDADELRAFCRERIAHHKIPRYVRIYERFPSSGGRALRYLLREESVAALGLEHETGS